MLAQEFSARADAIPYPTTKNREERMLLRREYDQAHANVNRDFAAALADEYLDEIPVGPRGTVAEAVFRRAWEDGHSAGYSSVEWAYEELAIVALSGFRAATA